jgi:hypothetical protein
MSKTDRALSAVFDVPEIKSFGVDDDEPDEMLPAVANQATNVAEIATPSTELTAGSSEQIDADTQFVKDTLKSLLGTGKDALESLVEIAKDEERASHFEAIAGMINQLSGVAMGILDAESKRQKLKTGLGEVPQTVNNIQNNTTNQVVFTGTTAELQAMLNQSDDVIDVTPNNEEEDE